MHQHNLQWNIVHCIIHQIRTTVNSVPINKCIVIVFSLPPTNHTPPNEPEPAKPPEKTNACTRFLSTCRSKIPCKCCKKETEPQQPKEEQNEDDTKTGCFNCRKKKPDQVQINIEPQEDEPKKKFLDRLKCCGKNKVGDRTGWFSKVKRKESWAQRRDSILSDPPLPK